MRWSLLRIVVAIAFLGIAEIASAMTALEFLRVETDNRDAPVMRQIVINLVAKGYRRFPIGRIYQL